jgi:hypothetical protein
MRVFYLFLDRNLLRIFINMNIEILRLNKKSFVFFALSLTVKM